MDFERSSQCLPGVDHFKRLPDGRFEGVIRVGIGPLSARFKGLAWFLDLIPPERLSAVAEVRDAITRSEATIEVTGTLSELGGSRTRFQYEMLIKLISVPMADVAYPMIKASAERLNDTFVGCLQSQFARGQA